MAKLSAIVANRHNSELEFVAGVMTTLDSGRKQITFTLKNVMPEVIGSQRIDKNAAEKVKAFDVESIVVGEEEFDDAGFDVDEVTFAGTYKGDMRLDVAKSTGEVSLRSESLAQYATGQRNARTGTSYAGNMLAQLQEKAAQRAGNVGVKPQ